jgi:hypothetical protein
MQADKIIASMATEAFAEHTVSDYPSKSWMVRGKDADYHFVITWTPGSVFVSGDIGGSAYSSYGFATLEETLAIIGHGDFEYLTSKSTHELRYNAYATAKSIVRDAYDRFRQGDTSLMERIVERTGDGIDIPADRKEACRSLLTNARANDLSEDEAYELVNDSGELCHKYGADANWHFQALQEWARQMRASEAKMAEVADRAQKFLHTGSILS